MIPLIEYAKQAFPNFQSVGADPHSRTGLAYFRKLVVEGRTVSVVEYGYDPKIDRRVELGKEAVGTLPEGCEAVQIPNGLLPWELQQPATMDVWGLSLPNHSAYLATTADARELQALIGIYERVRASGERVVRAAMQRVGATLPDGRPCIPVSGAGSTIPVPPDALCAAGPQESRN